jgi:hypothetical protein
MENGCIRLFTLHGRCCYLYTATFNIQCRCSGAARQAGCTDMTVGSGSRRAKARMHGTRDRSARGKQRRTTETAWEAIHFSVQENRHGNSAASGRRYQYRDKTSLVVLERSIFRIDLRGNRVSAAERETRMRRNTMHGNEPKQYQRQESA